MCFLPTVVTELHEAYAPQPPQQSRQQAQGSVPSTPSSQQQQAQAATVGSGPGPAPGPRRPRSTAEAQQAYRKATATFELASSLLRMLEWAAGAIPHAFLARPAASAAAGAAGSTAAAGVGTTGGAPAGAPMAAASAGLHLNRLMEVLWFVLTHFAEGSPDARRLHALLDSAAGPPPQPAAAASGSGHRSSLSLLLGLSGLAQVQGERSGGGQPSPAACALHLEKALMADKVSKKAVQSLYSRSKGRSVVLVEAYGRVLGVLEYLAGWAACSQT